MTRTTGAGATALALVLFLALGTLAAITGAQPVEIILFAQFANGLLLPVVAVFLLAAVNRKSLLGRHANGAAANVVAIAVIAVTAVLGVRALARVLASL